MRCYSDGYLKYIDIADPHEFAAKTPTCLSQDREVVLAIRVQYSPVNEDRGLLLFVPGEKFGSFTNAHLFFTII
jgi:hypothetical protein